MNMFISFIDAALEILKLFFSKLTKFEFDVLPWKDFPVTRKWTNVTIRTLTKTLVSMKLQK